MEILPNWTPFEWAVSAAIVTWLFTVLGLATSNRQANKREARKAYRSALDNLESDVDRLMAVYLAYLTEPGAVKNEQARISIYSELNRLRRHVESLKVDVGAELSGKYAELFEAITGGDFESKTRKLSDAGESHARAATAAENLMSCAETWFQQVYFRRGVWRFVFG